MAEQEKIDNDVAVETKPTKGNAKKTATKKAEKELNNKIEINPTLDDGALKEAASGTVVLGWGRMNPITTGHEKLINKIKQVAQDKGAVAQVFLTQSEDPKKNPLSYNDKIKLAQKAFGNMIVKTRSKTIIQVMQELQKKFKDVVLVVGSDRVGQFKTLLNKYNGKDYTFDSIEVVSAGERDPDADDVSGMSASKMRELAKDNNLAKFKQGLPKGLKSSAQAVFDMVRAGMQLAEELEAENVLVEAVLNQQQRRKRALIMRKYKTKIATARKRAMRRSATIDKLKNRARKKAINIIRQKVAGKKGVNYADLSPGEKMIIDKKVEKRKAAIDRIAKRMIPQVRRADLMRLSGKKLKEDIDTEFETFFEETMASDTLKPKAPKYHEARTKDGKMKFDGRFRAFRNKKELEEQDFEQRTKDEHQKEKEALKRQHQRELMRAKIRDARSSQSEEVSLSEKELIEWIDVLSDDIFLSVDNDEAKLHEALNRKAEKAGVSYDNIQLVYNLGMSEWTEDSQDTPQQLGFSTVNRYILSEQKDEFLAQLQEGINDPGIFKAVFLAGGPGSGKSFIVGKTALTSFGLRLINSDDAFEAQLKKAGLSTTPEDIFSDKGQEIRGRAKSLTKAKQKLALDGRLGLVIDGTGKDYDKIAKQAAMLRGMGYDTAMIFVNTDLETAQARNAARERTLPPAQVEKMWKDVQKNIGKFQNFFGRHMYILDNSDGANWEGGVNSAYKRIGAWIKAGPSNPTAKGWIAKVKAERGIKEEVELDEGIQQKLRKYVPGYAKKQIDKKMDAEKFGRRDVDKDANYWRYKKVQDKLKKEDVDINEDFENFTQGTEIDEGWAATKIKKVVFKGKYAKAAKALKALIDRKAKEAGGLSKMKHSPEYYASEIIRTTGTYDSIDARELAKMVVEQYQIDEKIAHELDPKKTLKHAMKDAIAAKDRDMDGDVDDLDKQSVATPDEITGAEKENLTKKYFANRKKEAQHTKVGVAYEAYGDMDRGTTSLTKKYEKDTPYMVIDNGVKKQKDGTYTAESDELFVTTNPKKDRKTFKEMNEEVSQKQIKDLEVFADRLLNKFNIDIEFTKHFADRMNDSRNDPAISIAELQQLFKKIAKEKGTNIKQNADAEVVLKDIQKDLNLPVVISYKKDRDEFEVVNKTIMRKKNFATSNKTIQYK